MSRRPGPSDPRSRNQKLRDLIANAGATEGEKAAARAALARIEASAGRTETPEDPLIGWLKDQPSKPPSRGVRIRYPSGQWYHFDEDQVDWQMVEAHRLRWRFDGERVDRVGRRRPGTNVHGGMNVRTKADAQELFNKAKSFIVEEEQGADGQMRRTRVMYKDKKGYWRAVGTVEEARVHLNKEEPPADSPS